MSFIGYVNQNPNLIFYFFISILFSGMITTISMPLINKWATKFQLLDVNDSRKKHKKNLVRLGGFGMSLGFTCSLILVFYLKDYYLLDFLTNKLIFSFLIIGMIYFLIGFIDDLFSISPFIRLSFQLIVSSFIWFIGIRISAIDLSWISIGVNTLELSELFSFLFTVIWISGVINAFNWIDGLDGLASGIALIISFTYLLIAFNLGITELTPFIASLLGSLMAFFFFNKYPARILMGDGGSYFIGSLIAILTIIIMSKDKGSFQINNALLILSLPVFDMSLVIIKRLKNKCSPFFPDRKHFHYVLIDLGINHKNTVLLLLNYTFWISSIVLCFYKVNYSFHLLLISTILFSFKIYKTKNKILSLFN